MNTDNARFSESRLGVLESVFREQHRASSLAGQFEFVCRQMLLNKEVGAWRAAADSQGGRGRAGSFFKALDPTSIPTSWAGADGQELSAAYLQLIRPQSLVDSIAAVATPLPERVSRVLVATGAVANTAVEGAPKAITTLSLSTAESDPAKAAAILVMSAELARLVGAAGSALFQRLLQDAVIRASNESLVGQVTTTSIGTTGTAVGDLEAGLAAAPNATAYVVSAQPQVARALAMSRPNDSNLGITGGVYVAGISIVAVAAAAGDPLMTIYPASEFAFADSGLIVRNSSQASVEMSATPDNPATADTVLTSLWQENLVAILIERRFRLFGVAKAVEVVAS